MRRFFIGGSLLIAALLLSTGCGSTNRPGYAATGESGYAGGTGAFGEDPVNPGEHSRERFMNAIQASQQANSQASQPVTSR
jgi:hypothetical protein